MSDLAEQLEIRLAGARLKPERSTAFPQEYYRDPATHVKFESEKGKRGKSMELVTLPVEMLDSNEYDGLRPTEKQFLIDLYICYGDCETFTIDVERPGEYRQRHCDAATIYRKLRTLNSCGLLLVDYQNTGRQGPPKTIYSFKYKVPQNVFDTRN